MDEPCGIANERALAVAQRGVNQPYNMSVLAFSLVTAAIARRPGR